MLEDETSGSGGGRRERRGDARADRLKKQNAALKAKLAHKDEVDAFLAGDPATHPPAEQQEHNATAEIGEKQRTRGAETSARILDAVW